MKITFNLGPISPGHSKGVIDKESVKRVLDGIFAATEKLPSEILADIELIRLSPSPDWEDEEDPDFDLDVVMYPSLWKELKVGDKPLFTGVFWDDDAEKVAGQVLYLVGQYVAGIRGYALKLLQKFDLKYESLNRTPR